MRCASSYQTPWLQWSHDLSAMDTSLGRFTMGVPVRLQWNHDLSAMDTQTISGTFSDDDGLQWSHDLSAMDTVGAEASEDRISDASMEP